MQSLPGAPHSCWSSTAARTAFPCLTDKAKCDVLVVGAGIVGLTAALALCEAGKSVIVLEARQLGHQVTGRSSAKITTQHGLIYRYLIENCGRDTAMAYANANRAAVDQMRHWIGILKIACDYEAKSAYAYACTPEWEDAITREAQAARSLGFDARVLERAPLPFATSAALEFPDQAQFNPVSYLVELAAAVRSGGGRIYEHSPATAFDYDEQWRVGTADAVITAAQVVIATNMPVHSPESYTSRTQPRCHVAMAFRTQEPQAIDGMFIGIDEPTHSLRAGHDRTGPLLVVLGPRFNTGQDGNVAQRFRDLDQWAHANLPVGQALWRWCNEDYDTADCMPFVGQPSPREAPGFYIATGFNGWGISNGTAAGAMIAAEISSGSRPWGKLFDPARSAPDGFHKNTDTQSWIRGVDHIAPGEGGVIKQGDKKIAVWRDTHGTLHGFSACCTHEGCPVTWNNADKTWDCPCHGSVFEATGAVIHGPAITPLPAYPL